MRQEVTTEYTVVPVVRKREERKTEAISDCAETYSLSSSWIKVEIYPGM
jgi:hypothetical protein